MQSFESSISESCSTSTDQLLSDDQESLKTEHSLSPRIISDHNQSSNDDTIFNLIRGNTLRPKSKTKVLIVGAGLAGLAAAQRLWSSGIEDIILLEAQDYIGGRVKTVRHSDGILEVGAQYFHGAEENPIYDWVNNMVKLSGFEDGTILMQGLYFTATGEQLPQSLVNQFLNLIMNIKIALFNRERNGNSCQAKKKLSLYDKSAGQEFRKEFEEHLDKDSNLCENKSQLMSLFEWFLRSEAIENGCDCMDEVSMASYVGWTDFSDGATLDFHWGYQTLLRWFLDQIPTSQIVHLNCEVTNIELDNKIEESQQHFKRAETEAPVKVRYRISANNNDGEMNQLRQSTDNYIECSHVIVTSSMGYLKRNLTTLFTPPLPSAKQELIKTIGYGTVNKIFLQFDEPFWLKLNKATDDEGNIVDGIKLVWRQQDFNDGYFPVWARDITSFERVKRQPNILVAWIGGTGAKLMEPESDHFIGETCVRILERFLSNPVAEHGSVKPSKLIWCMATRWFSNPYICGSYSFHSMKSQDKDIMQLHEPIYDDDNQRNSLPRILFAGEAIAGELYSTTHGAILSGWRQADQIINSNRN